MGEELRELVLNGGSAADLKRMAIQTGMKTLRQSGISKMREGLTTIAELVRVTMAD